MLISFLFVFFLVLILFWVLKNQYKDKKRLPERAFPNQWEVILKEKVPFYQKLSVAEKEEFKYRIHVFLLNVKITGIDTKVDDLVRVLVASSGIIPVFRFKDWNYHFLDEVLIYPSAFNLNYQFKGQGLNAIGLVGTGEMEGKMILSKKALIKGFSNETDKLNVGIHEFIHLIDKQDGKIDGVPKALMEQSTAINWLDLIRQKTMEINDDKSNIRAYAATNSAEFFSVTSEYFFERPELLQKKHPELYAILEKVFTPKQGKKK